ncbi:DUF3291 domain-containing protein [Streptomonospora litoralis]|nr:DUF3291 domain-containing protein [Streptomonospora litoralis]
MSDHRLAQLNIAALKAPLDDPALADFVALLDPINALAEASPGFVWRYVDENGADATAARPFGDDLIVNFSLWADRDSLWNFTYRSGHLDLLRRRREWFTRMAAAHQVMWWVPAGRIPTIEEAGERLALLRANGPSPEAFTFTDSYPPPSAPPTTAETGTPETATRAGAGLTPPRPASPSSS